MPFREKLKSLIHRHDDEPASPSSSARQSRYESSSQAQSPSQGQRPASGSGLPSQASPARSRSKLRRSFDRRSNPIPGESTRRSLDSKRKSLDQRQINSGVAPSVPDVPSTYKDQNIARPAVSQDAETKAAKERARKSSHVMNFSHINGAQPLSERSDKYSEDVADWNIMSSEKPNPTHAPAPLNVKKTSAEKSRRSSSSSSSSSSSRSSSAGVAAIRRKPVNFESPRTSRELDARRKSVSSTKQRQRLSTDKPLPSPPKQSALSEDPALGKFLPNDHHYLVKDASKAPSLEGVVNLHNTVDTTVTESWAPAVTHETVRKDIHHVREEVVTREIHNHDVYHRILPIVDIEVLPARHFVPTGNGNELMEIAASEIPGRTGYNQEWFVGEMLSKLPADSKVPSEPRRFTARQFRGDEGDYKEYRSGMGVPTTETTWVHPPTIDDTAMLAGQTEPFYFGSANAADDGLRIRAPNGRVAGSSRLHVEQLNRPVTPVTPPTESMKNLSVGDYLQAMPSAEATGDETLTPYERREKKAVRG